MEADRRFGDLEAEGWAVLPGIAGGVLLDALADALEPLWSDSTGRGGVRNLLDVPEVRELARSGPIRGVVEAALGPGCVAVRGLLFDKTPGANWRVPWHQDLTIAMADRRDVEGFGPWSEKGGVPHVQAPTELLARMLAVRLHLDDCGPENGPIRFLPGSHRSGKLDAAGISAWRGRVAEVAATAGRGQIVAFRPLLLHASSPAESPARRRVVHIEYAAGGPLPEGLRWRWSV